LRVDLIQNCRPKIQRTSNQNPATVAIKTLTRKILRVLGTTHCITTDSVAKKKTLPHEGDLFLFYYFLLAEVAPELALLLMIFLRGLQARGDVVVVEEENPNLLDPFVCLGQQLRQSLLVLRAVLVSLSLLVVLPAHAAVAVLLWQHSCSAQGTLKSQSQSKQANKQITNKLVKTKTSGGIQSICPLAAAENPPRCSWSKRNRRKKANQREESCRHSSRLRLGFRAYLPESREGRRSHRSSLSF
jgi:hypothetical protein